MRLKQLKIQQTRDLVVVDRLDRFTFPGEPISEWSLKTSTWWIVKLDGEAVAHAGCRIVDGGATIYLNRAGVLSTARGMGIQRDLIKARLRWGRRRGIRHFLTYTSIDNARSANNLIQCGFRMYVPAWAWAGREFCYWYRSFGKDLP